MAILIDPPAWPAYGRLWSHLVSDTSLAELHHFAAAHGLSRRLFEGDHYDVPDTAYADLVAVGARPVTSREVVTALRAAGLRLRKRKGERPVERLFGADLGDGVPRDVDLLLSDWQPPPERTYAASVLLRDARGRCAVVYNTRRRVWGPPAGRTEPGEDAVATAVREVAEETGVRLRPAQLTLLGHEVFRPAMAPGRDLLAFLTATVDGDGADLHGIDDETTGHAWVTPAEMERRCSGEFWWPLVGYVLALGPWRRPSR
ncbi:DUF4031 domain-containing protein [Nocardioides sp. CFH 31398]|uniref:DUF4031 domain-containing protein n=1 Tax=Nocardioides sp. CFH 31398 TaxID=2919579 RepID=UPI001F06E7D9|nr:DUF4031 domain-containing protein [Nocardioides sp. CFH 31398]MCH1868245.1 DUF4031 domain-containing protein [Nocardioides sp. CFH 31398]